MDNTKQRRLSGDTKIDERKLDDERLIVGIELLDGNAPLESTPTIQEMFSAFDRSCEQQFCCNKRMLFFQLRLQP